MLRSALRKRDVSYFFVEASTSVNQTGRTDPSLKGLCFQLLKDCGSLSDEGRADRDTLIAQAAINGMAGTLFDRKHFRKTLERKQTSAVLAMLKQWRSNVLRSEVGAAKDVMRTIRKHFDGIVAWIQTRQTTPNLTAII